MRRYKFDGDTKLQSKVVAERQKPNRYYRVEVSDIQGLNSADTPERNRRSCRTSFTKKSDLACGRSNG